VFGLKQEESVRRSLTGSRGPVSKLNYFPARGASISTVYDKNQKCCIKTAKCKYYVNNCHCQFKRINRENRPKTNLEESKS
jgi:hypothetical protein